MSTFPNRIAYILTDPYSGYASQQQIWQIVTDLTQFFAAPSFTGNMSVTGDFSVTGTTTLTGNTGITGDVTITSGSLSVEDGITTLSKLVIGGVGITGIVATPGVLPDFLNDSKITFTIGGDVYQVPCYLVL